VEFVKAHALGNDFIIIDGLARKVELTAERIQNLCDRRFGIGADGILLLLPSKKTDFKMRIFNADGGEAEMCGNGIRCLAKYIYEKGLSSRQELTIETLAGNRYVTLNIVGGKVQSVRVDMGEPNFARSKIPMLGRGKETVGELLKVGDLELSATCLSMGNPHCVVVVSNVKTAPVERLGPTIEYLPIFLERTNVEFVEVLNKNELRIRVWERGAGETLACGTGAAASLVAAARNNHTGRKATVHLQGGDLLVEWARDGRVYLTGPATLVYSGKFYDSY
jgi:diaminopimelate epimerase